MNWPAMSLKMTVLASIPALTSAPQSPLSVISEQRCRIHFALADVQFTQDGMETGLSVETPLQMILEQADGGFGQFAPAHVVEGRLADDILAAFAA